MKTSEVSGGQRFSLKLQIGLAALGVLLLDVVASLLARSFAIRYTHFAPASLIYYAVVGAAVARRHSLTLAAGAGLLVSLCDATLGWWLSAQLGAARVATHSVHRVAVRTLTVCVVVVFATIFTWACAAMYKLATRGRS